MLLPATNAADPATKFFMAARREGELGITQTVKKVIYEMLRFDEL